MSCYKYLESCDTVNRGDSESFPQARVGVISAFRKSPPDFKVEMDHAKIPRIKPDEIVIIADPMLATGSTMVKILEEVSKKGKGSRTIILCVLSADVALEKLRGINSEIEVYTCSIDPFLNERGYVVPDLGDAGTGHLGMRGSKLPPYK
jgi:uracil phosphoribosyltransferase